MWFNVPYLLLVVYGFLACGWFLETWLRGVKKVTIGALDSGGWVILIFLALGMALVNLVMLGWPEIRSVPRGVQGLFIYTILDLVVTVRVVKWRRIRREEILDEEEGRQ